VSCRIKALRVNDSVLGNQQIKFETAELDVSTSGGEAHLTVQMQGLSSKSAAMLKTVGEAGRLCKVLFENANGDRMVVVGKVLAVAVPHDSKSRASALISGNSDHEPAEEVYQWMSRITP
jgi:hypothetical protein